jgi:uncharacterized protein YneF (UPF0154 family)
MLVICTNTEKLPKIQTTEFQIGGIYRHIKIDENNQTEHMVYGVIFDKKTFKECFKSYAPIIQERARKIFYENGKPISKTNFKNNYANVHQYGKITTGFKMVYVGHPKVNCFAIYPIGNTKERAINFAYETMLLLCNGSVDLIDLGRVKWFNTGIPITVTNSWWNRKTDSEFIPKKY